MKKDVLRATFPFYLYETEVLRWLWISHSQHNRSEHNRTILNELDLRGNTIKLQQQCVIVIYGPESKHLPKRACVDSDAFSHRYLYRLRRTVSLFRSAPEGTGSSGISTVINQSLSTRTLSLSVYLPVLLAAGFPGRCQIPAVRNNCCPAEFRSTYSLSTPPVSPHLSLLHSTPRTPICRGRQSHLKHSSTKLAEVVDLSRACFSEELLCQRLHACVHACLCVRLPVCAASASLWECLITELF